MYEIITNFRNLSNPPQSEIDKYNEKVNQLINQLGSKYRLFETMPKIEQGSKE